nr:HAD-IC family P-type ATPase [Gemmatimonadaceae bacterium]
MIAGVVVLNALVGFAQEWRARAAIDALAGRLATPATVVRDGRRDRIDAAMLVPGDIVLLEGGDRVPADLRLLESAECAIDESALTGESLPSAKDAAATLDAATPLGDRRTMAYASTHVTRGTARGLVVATGDATEIGRVAELLATAQQLETPLTRRLEHFSRILLALILGFAVVLVLVGTLRGEQPLDMLLAAVALAVAAIPEGLPAALTITLAIGVARMARRRAIIRRLPAVETLGSTTVVCSDKTGTLTENAMTVQQLVIDRAHWHVTGLGYEPVGTIIPTVDAAVESPALRALLTAGVRCNDASLGRDAEGRWTITGDPTEAALLVAAGKGGVDLVAIQAATPRTGALPFASERQWMATRHAEGAGARLVVKGAVERVLARCTTAQDSDGRRIALDAAQVHRDAEALAADGLRVLAIAERIDEQPTAPLDESGIGDLVLLGLVGMLDPPREAAAAAVAACHRAGISVKMITGDHVGTARAIAARIGLRDADGTLHALTGAELARVPTADFADTVARTTVFARVAPEQKLRIVEALQRRGHVVAMTGDGVNDAPALRAADIGVAMGIAGTDVAREASDMVLVDDDFATIAAAVEEGRGVFDNLVKFLAWTLPTNIGEGLVILVAIAAGIALPILPVQILWINMTTAVCLGLTLAVE